MAASAPLGFGAVSWRIGIVGSRDWSDLAMVSSWFDNQAWPNEFTDDLKEFQPTIVSGGARGVDTEAVRYAEALDFPTEVMAADWDTHGKAAGPIRNEALVKSVDHVVAFWDGKSRGTRNVIDLALRYHVNLEVVFP